MPPTGRRKARNKDTEQQRSEADTPDTMTTPSRKRRRTNGAEGATNATPTTSTKRSRRASVESDETIENGDNEEPSAYALAEEVIRHLRIAHYDVGVAIDHNNTIVEQSAQAFAKIAGRTWTFYVSALSVRIGRPNARPRTAAPTEYAKQTSADDMTVDIDLGPDQQVSRLHAEIAYDSERELWFIIVNGRNGLTVDEQRMERGQKMYLHSGNVINVLGTQMMFMLPDEPPVVHPGIKRALLIEDEDEDEADLPEEKHPRSFARGGRSRAANAFQSATQARPPPQDNTRTASQPNLPLSSSQPQPGTPVARREQPQPKSKPSPAYSRGVLLESTEEIDYSADGAKDIKPPHSYAQMIGQAILSTPEENATLARIYDFIKEKYAFFRFGGGGWQNSIRHNLSLSKHFEKIPRRTDEPGKGMKWQIVPEHRTEYMKKNFHDNRRGPRRIGSSGPNSPAVNTGPSVQTERLMGVLSTGEFKASPRSTTPPLTSYPAPTESFTPDRGPRPGSLHTASGVNGVHTGSAHSTPTHDRSQLSIRQPALSNAGPSAISRGGLIEAAVNSPPTLTGSAYDAMGAGNLFTPMVARQAPKLGVQSTIKAPSHYAQGLFSSPAPFWKYVDVGSTPAKPSIFDDVSPEKKPRAENAHDADEDEEMRDEVVQVEGEESKATKQDDDAHSNVDAPQLSSPPVPQHHGASSGGEGPDESPSRTISRPVSRREGPTKKTLEPRPLFAPTAPKLEMNPAISGPAFNPYIVVANDDEEEEGIDLAKGFQKIGSFHRTMQAASSVTH